MSKICFHSAHTTCSGCHDFHDEIWNKTLRETVLWSVFSKIAGRIGEHNVGFLKIQAIEVSCIVIIEIAVDENKNLFIVICLLA